MRTVAALYIDPRGPYPKLPGVDCWDAARDARLYDGLHPVVAHPPCGPWGRLAFCSRETTADCGPRAVAQVRAYGGVLEHPAHSRLWQACGLPKPGERPDCYGGCTIEVAQVEWGHVARKRTWLYLVGLSWNALEASPFPGREPTHWCSGFRTTKGAPPAAYRRTGSAVPAGVKVASAQQRRRTPPLFAEYLVRLARAVQ